MVWECFCNNKLGPLVLIEGTININQSIKILENYLISFINKLENINKIIFQEDNISSYTILKTKK